MQLADLAAASALVGATAARSTKVRAIADALRAAGPQETRPAGRTVPSRAAAQTAEEAAMPVTAPPAAPAQEVCDRLVAAGVTSILNFAPAVLAVPPGVDLRKVDLSLELQILSFHEHRKAARSSVAPAPREEVPA